MWATTLWDHGVVPLQWGVAGCAALIAAAYDVTSWRIPNCLTGSVLLAGLIWAGAYHGLQGLADASASCVLLALPYVVLFIFAGGGAGDAKLMAAIGSWLGLVNGLAVLFAVSFAAVVLAVAVAASKKRLLNLLVNLAWIVLGMFLFFVGRSKAAGRSVPPAEHMQKMPYGVAIFSGVCLGAAGVMLWRL